MSERSINKAHCQGPVSGARAPLARHLQAPDQRSSHRLYPLAFLRSLRETRPGDPARRYPASASEATNFTNWEYTYNQSAPDANPTVQFEYDRIGQNTAEIDPNGTWTEFEYNGRSLRTRVIDPTGAVRSSA